MRLKSLSRLLEGCEVSPDNLHRIAISNLRDQERQVERWWASKYKTPLKPYDAHTSEELVIEMLEDYYAAHPQEADRFVNSELRQEWDGTTSTEYECDIKKRLSKLKQVDTSRFESESENDLSEEEVMDQLRKSVPSSPMKPKDEFEEDFG